MPKIESSLNSKSPKSRQVAQRPVAAASAANPNGRGLKPSPVVSSNSDDEETQPPVSGGSIYRGMSSFLMSTVVHMLAVIILAMITLKSPPESDIPNLTASQVVELEEFEDFQVEEFQFESEEAIAFSVEDPGMAELGELPAIDPSALDSATSVSNPTDQIGALFGEHGSGWATQGRGSGGAEFYGMKARGTRFIFVVDNSLSMNNGRFESACYELGYTVSKMAPDQFFYVYFFSDTAYPLFYPKTAEGMVRATQENKDKLVAWLHTIHLVLKTNARKAVESSIAMNPSAIYVLTDGAFTDNTSQLLLGMTPKPLMSIHTVGMEIDGKNEETLKKIAAHHNGSYRHVTTDSRFRIYSKQNPLQRDSKPGPIWGIALGNTQKKAKPKGQPKAKPKGQAGVRKKKK